MTPTPSHWDSLLLELIHIHDAEVLPWGRKVKAIPRANYYRVWLLRAGHGRIKVGSRWHKFTAGEWMVPSPMMSAQEFSNDSRILSLHFRAHWPDGGLLFEIDTKAKWPGTRYPELEAASLAIHNSCRQSSPPPYGESALPETLSFDQYLQMAEVFRRWLRVFCAIMTTEGHPPTTQAVLDERVRTGLRWLNRLPLNASFREPTLAEHLGLSVIHLNRLFMRELKLTPAAFLEKRRWERASYLLLNSTRSAKEIAYELGFCAPSYFTTWVKNRSGKTPLQFRRRC